MQILRQALIAVKHFFFCFFFGAFDDKPEPVEYKNCFFLNARSLNKILHSLNQND